MQTGEGSRSSTPGAVLDGRVMFTSHPSPSLSSQSLSVSSYPSISSPSPSASSAGSLGQSIFSGVKYLASTPPQAHRYMSDTYRLSSEPVDQNRYLVDPNRMSVDPYRQQAADSHRTTADLQRIRDDQTIESYHRSTEDIYQNNNPIDLQRVPGTNSQQLLNAQRLVSELQRMHSDQRLVDDLRSSSGMTAESLQRHEIHASSTSPSGSSTLNYRNVLNSEPIRSPSEPPPQRLVQESMLRSHADPQRLVQESFREYFTASQRHVLDNARTHADTRLVAAENLRYIPSSPNLRVETTRYTSSIAPQRSMMVENLRLADEPSHTMVTETLRLGSETSHSIMPENLRIGEQHSMLPENLRVGAETPHTVMPENLRVEANTPHSMIPENLRVGADTPHSMIPENLRVGANTPHSMIPENLRVGGDTSHSMIPENLRVGADTPHSMIPENLRVTPDASRMVPENLCLTEPSHQALPENLHISHDVVVNGRASLSSTNGDTNNGRMMNHSQSSGDSPMPLMRSHFNPASHKLMAESSHPMRVQSPHYTDNVYRNDIHSNLGHHAPPTPAPSIPPPMVDQVSTPLPQYYSSYTSHSTHSTPATHDNQYPAYINDPCEDRDMRDGMSLEEKIERGYQDIKPFDQDYPVSMPMMHMSQDVLPPPPPVPKPPKPKKPKEPKPPRLPIIHKCNECHRVFKNSTQLKNHMWRHTGEKPFTCDECGSKFTQQGNLRAHRRIHTGERPYQCLECKACFTQLSTLKTHQKIHSDERPYKCNECDAAFRQVANLKTHQVTHTGERPHKCDQCDKAFTQKSNLKAHKNRVHYGEGLSAPAKRGRKKNPVAIKPFPCLECGAKFTVLSNLKIHAKLHTGDKPFECDYCGAGFAQRSNLKTHIQRMHGKTKGPSTRSIKCDECPARFRLRRCLKTHKKRRHPIKSLKIKILRESRYHMNSTVVEGGEEGGLGGEEDEDLDDEEDEGDLDDEDEEEDEDEDGDDESEDREDSKVNLCRPSKSGISLDDVYESGFNSTDEESIGDFRSRERTVRPSSVVEPFIQIQEPKVERVDSPLSSHDDMAVSMAETQLNTKQEVFDDPSAGENDNFLMEKARELAQASHLSHHEGEQQTEAVNMGGEMGDAKEGCLNNYMGEGRASLLPPEGRGNSLPCHLLPSNYESKNLSIALSPGS